jgi:hypothetical protein
VPDAAPAPSWNMIALRIFPLSQEFGMGTLTFSGLLAP